MDVQSTKNQGRRKASSTSLECSICQASFRRPEHLKRHLRSHTKEKPFQCTQCSRRFSRSDTLHRHDQSHHAPGVQGKLDYTHRITVKTFRACFQCATARVRCSGGDPCSRCQTRTIRCQYPTERRSKTKRVQGPPEISVELRPNESDSPEQATIENGVVPQGSVASGSPPPEQMAQQLQFRFINYDTVPQSNPRHSDEIGDVDNQQRAFVEHTLNSSQLPYSYVEQDSSRIFTHDTGSSFPITSQNNLPIPQDNQPVDPLIQDGNVSITNQPLELTFDQNLFHQDPGSVRNWLSTDLLKGTQDSLPVDEDHLSQSIQQWWPETFDTSTTWLSHIPPVDQISLFDRSQQQHLDLVPSVESPGTYSSVSQEGSVFSESNDGSTRSGEYYIDGEGARCPKYSRKRKTCWEATASSIPLPQSQGSSREGSYLSFPQSHNIQTGESCLNGIFDKHILPDTYEKIILTFEKLCCNELPMFTPFETGHFVDCELLTHFIQLYMEGFQPIYPIFHIPTFDPNEIHWILTLALSAIGCSFANSSETAQYAYPLHEFVRRAIIVEKEKSMSGSVPLWLMQAMLLNCVGLVHGRNDQAKEYGLSLFSDLVRLARREKLFSTPHKVQERDTGKRWKDWIESERRRRTAYLIWLLDSTLAYTTDSQPLLSLKDAQTPLPSHERLWEADSEYTWQKLYQDENPSLYAATEILFIEKRLVPGIAEFSNTLLLHALYQRLWEVSEYFQRPLSCWNPVAEKQARESAIPSRSIWLPGVSLYSKWRNSACDCLDTLHWSANGTIAKAAGLEHPTVLHLHAARIVLLVPFREIRSLALSLAQAELSWDKLEQTPEWHHIWRWGKHDQYKARLSLIHAGSVLWHVRRYSTNSFHEPITVFLATLTLWAYGICHHQTRDSPQDHNPSSLQQATTFEAGSSPTFIHLDRPCDDEIVQLFVRVGQTMRGNVTGVGDICGPYGPSRILQEGVRTLSGLVSAWGVAHEYIDILSRLGDQTVSSMSPTVQN